MYFFTYDICVILFIHLLLYFHMHCFFKCWKISYALLLFLFWIFSLFLKSSRKEKLEFYIASSIYHVTSSFLLSVIQMYIWCHFPLDWRTSLAFVIVCHSADKCFTFVYLEIFYLYFWRILWLFIELQMDKGFCFSLFLPFFPSFLLLLPSLQHFKYMYISISLTSFAYDEVPATILIVCVYM